MSAGGVRTIGHMAAVINGWLFRRRWAHLGNTAHISALLALLSNAALVSSAVARPPEHIQAAKAATLVTEIFRRMFFTLWLGEAMSLRTIGACPDAQIRSALQNRDAFPDSFKKEPPVSARQGQIYCSPVSKVSAPQEFKTITIRAPKVRSCEEYAGMWKRLTDEPRLAEGLTPYVVRTNVYDKYKIPADGRSLYNNLDRSQSEPNLISGQGRANRYVILETKGTDDFCTFVLSFDETRSPATRR